MLRRLTNAAVAVVRAGILAKQKGRCAICDISIIKEDKRPALDHDHTTGVVRGVLCNNCNGLEGKINNIANRAKRERTTLEWLKSLISYLEFHQTDRTGMLHPTHKTLEEKRILTNKRARLKRQAAAKARPAKPKATNEE